jgi:hypothetical protein
MNHTPGKWDWHTSNNWRRLYSDQGHGKQVPVLMPVICLDEQPEIEVTRADMALIAAAPEMLSALQAVDKYFKVCARIWAMDEGRVVNEEGHVIVAAEGLDELAENAGVAVASAIAKAEGW